MHSFSSSHTDELSATCSEDRTSEPRKYSSKSQMSRTEEKEHCLDQGGPFPSSPSHFKSLFNCAKSGCPGTKSVKLSPSPC